MDIIERNAAAMKRFETAINTADEKLADELIASDASFFTPVSLEPLYGGAGYISVVHFMRRSFPDIHWKLEDMAVDEGKAAVWWTCSGTHQGEFMGLPATGKSVSFSVMNFYYFNADGKIIRDVAAEGLAGLFKALGMIG